MLVLVAGLLLAFCFVNNFVISFCAFPHIVI